MTVSAIEHYAGVYESRQRDPVIDRMNRASVANGRMNRWQRFHKAGELVWVDTPFSETVALTPTQVRVWQFARSMMEDQPTRAIYTMREMARRLSVSPSTVSRALAKLASFGLLAYMTGRGRYRGTLVIARVRGDGLDRFRAAAKTRVRRWKEAADRRFSRLALNVAPYILRGDVDSFVASRRSYSSSSSMGATLTVQRSWTPEELREAGII